MYLPEGYGHKSISTEDQANGNAVVDPRQPGVLKGNGVCVVEGRDTGFTESIKKPRDYKDGGAPIPAS